MYKKTSDKILVVGGNDAGLSAAGRAKRLNPDLDVTVFEKTPFVGYASCALPYLISGEITTTQLKGSTPSEIKEKRNIDVYNNTIVNSINTLNKSISITDLQSKNQNQIKYDKLVLATGAKAILPAPFSPSQKNVFTLRNYADAIEILSFLESNSLKSAAIIGGSFIGIEMAEALYKRGLQISLIEKAPNLFPGISEQLSKKLFDLLHSNGISILTNTTITDILLDNRRVNRLYTNGLQQISADIVIVAAGIEPDTMLAENAGIPLGKSGALIVNDYMQTRRLDVLAIGDCVETKHIVTGKPHWMPLAGIASKQGRIAGTNLGGKKENFKGALGTAMVKVFNVEFGMTGLTKEQAMENGFDPVVSTIVHKNKPGYVPGASDIMVALIVERKNQRILGGQIFGNNDAGLRLNILAAAITAKMTANDLEFMDFGYTPLISNIWDPLSISGNRAQKIEVNK